jgi:hypothetical protein
LRANPYLVSRRYGPMVRRTGMYPLLAAYLSVSERMRKKGRKKNRKKEIGGKKNTHTIKYNEK